MKRVEEFFMVSNTLGGSRHALFKLLRKEEGISPASNEITTAFVQTNVLVPLAQISSQLEKMFAVKHDSINEQALVSVEGLQRKIAREVRPLSSSTPTSTSALPGKFLEGDAAESSPSNRLT